MPCRALKKKGNRKEKKRNKKGGHSGKISTERQGDHHIESKKNWTFVGGRKIRD